MAKKADKKKTSKSYAGDNPLNPRHKKWSKKKNFRSENPYLKTKGKKTKGNEKENPVK